MKRKALLVALAVLVMATGVFAAHNRASKSFRIHQNAWPDANDLHFTVYLPDWQNSSDYIESWKLTVNPCFPTQKLTPDYSSACNKVTKLGIEYSETTIPYCTWIKVKIQLNLSHGNKMMLSDIFWTRDGDTICSTVPRHGFQVDAIDPGGNSTYLFYNDSEEELLLKDFRFAPNQADYVDPDELFEFDGWTDSVETFSVPAGGIYAISLENMVDAAFLFARYDIYRPGIGPDSDELLSQEADIHEAGPGQEPLNIEESGLLNKVKFLNVDAYPDYSEVRYQLPKACHVNLTVYSLAGEKLVTLVDEVQSAGGHTVRWDGGDAPAGLYFCRLAADGIQATEKMIRLK